MRNLRKLLGFSTLKKDYYKFGDVNRIYSGKRSNNCDCSKKNKTKSGSKNKKKKSTAKKQKKKITK